MDGTGAGGRAFGAVGCLIALAVILCAAASLGGSPQPAGAGQPESGVGLRAGKGPEFRGRVRELSPKLRKRMKGSSWHRGCPVGLGRLRHVAVRHWNFDREPRMGELVVHERYARRIMKVMKRAWRERFPIRKMRLIDRYGADDHRSMAADNTSAFNCRYVAGTSRWSMHAYGKAIDVNPRENPYVSGDHVSPPEGRPYAKRRPKRQGMLYGGGPVTKAMKRIAGWEWGGRWPGPIDYQHFSSDGT